MENPILSISNLSTSLRVDGEWRNVVRNISFDIAPRETVAVVGESGSGKSVMALSIMQLLPKDDCRIEGSVKLEEKELLGFREMRSVRGNDIAMIFQEPMTSLNPVLTVGFQVAEALMIHRGLSRPQAEAEAVRLLERVRIPAAQSRVRDYPHQFSGGMRQRVMIAMALACKPRLLIADEPTTALDVTIQAQVLDLIKALQDEEGMSMLFITHDMGVVAEIADRTVVMYNGDQIESGLTGDIFNCPAMPYTRSLLSAVPRLGSMTACKRPLRFPIVDRDTGESDVPTEVADTVKSCVQPLLQVSGLTTRFDIRSSMLGRVVGRVHAVENISFSIQPGETLALVGESGCGKSTTGRSLMRLTQPHSGSVKLEGVELLDLKDAEMREKRKHIQMIFQDPFASLNPRRTVGDIIADPIIVNGLGGRVNAHERSIQLLREVGLRPEMAHRFPHEFSGGQRQRICIARALALEPTLIVADEAVSALDASVKAQVVNLMLELQARMGLAYLFISHDMAVVERISHRVAVMYLGEIVEIGPREAIFCNPQHNYTRRLLAAVPIADPARRSRKCQLNLDELRSPVRPANYEPPVRKFREASPGHLVMI